MEQIDSIKELLQQGAFDEAIQKLVEVAKGSAFFNEAIVHRARFQELMNGKRKGTLTDLEIDAKRNELFFSILELLDQMEEQIPAADSEEKWKMASGLLVPFGIGGVFLFLFLAVFLIGKPDFSLKRPSAKTEHSPPKDTLAEKKADKIEDPPDPAEEMPLEDTLTGTFEVIYSLNDRKINLELINAAYPVRFNFAMNSETVFNASLKDCRKCELTLTVPVEKENDNFAHLIDRHNKVEYLGFKRVDEKWVAGKVRERRDGESYNFVLANGYMVFAENLRFVPEKGSWCYMNKEAVGDCGDGRGRFYSFTAAAESCPKGWRIPSSKDFRAILSHFKGLNQEQVYQKLTTYEFGSPFLKNGLGFRRPNEGFEYNREKSYYWLNDGRGPKKAIAINNKDKSITIEEVNEDLAMPCICVRKYTR